MENSTQLSDYFRASENTFWRWAADGVIEWKNGKTICYRDDLFNIMRSLSESGLPPLETLLLAFAACGKEAEDATLLFVLIDGFAKELAGTDHNEEASYKPLITKAVDGLIKMNSLSPDWKTGHRRTHLFAQVFLLNKNVFKNVLTGSEVATAIDEYNSLHVQNYSYSPRRKYTTKQFTAALHCFATLSEQYADAKQLENHLRTGLPAIPLPAPVEIPEEKKQGDLLQQLLEEPKTSHISRLAKKMLAALHIPMHLQSSGGASYGGVSDITNRGHFDKLLLSELAADNTLLLTRLVHNEALYLCREEPPNNPKTRRLILLDTTLRLWGTPRVFAVSAAIACTQNLRPGETVEAYTLGGHSFAQTDLTTTEGVLKTMERLDAALHCTTALSTCLDEVGSNGQNDTIFITGAEMVTEPLFQRWLAAAGDVLDFIITVNGNGELHFSSVSAGRLKQLSYAMIDLAEILSEKKPAIPIKKTTEKLEALPAFFSLEKPPILFPAVHLKMKNKNDYHFYHGTIGLFGITETQRLLHWVAGNKGAMEWILNVARGKHYRFYYDENDSICLIVSNDGSSQADFYYINTQNNEVRHYTIDVPGAIAFFNAALHGDTLYTLVKDSNRLDNAVAVINIRYGTIEKQCSWIACHERFKAASGTLAFYANDTPKYVPQSLGKFINNGYTVLIRIRTIFIDVDEQLCLNDFCFTAPTNSYNFISLRQGVKEEKKPATQKSEELPLAQNVHLWLKQFSWNDGSTATVDSRGLLHLKSSDTSLPEVTLVLIQSKPTAGWAADGALCGSEYFRKSVVSMMPVQHFYSKYITPFIQTILQKA